MIVNKNTGEALFIGGIDNDSNPAFIKRGDYIYALNIVENTTSEEHRYFLSNEEGFTLFSDFLEKKPKNIILNMTNINSIVIVFSITVNDKLETTSSQIGYIKDNIYYEVLDDTNPIYWKAGYYDINKLSNYTQPGLLNFNINYQIQTFARTNFNNDIIVYWVDDINTPKVININIDYSLYENQFQNIERDLQIFKKYDLPSIRLDSIIEGGELLAGTYQFACRYVNKDNSKSPFSLISNNCNIIKTNRDIPKEIEGANFDYIYINRAIKLFITNIDNYNDYLEIAVIRYKGSASEIESFVFAKIPIKDTLPYTTIIFDGKQRLYDISLQEILEQNVYYENSKVIHHKDNRLFLANLKSSKNIDLQPIANKLILRYEIKDMTIDLNSTTPVDEDSFSYLSDKASFYFRGYAREEVYSFAIVGITETGEETFAFHIPAKFIVDKSLYSKSGNKWYYPSGSGILGIYESEEIYSERGVYFDENGNDLYGKPIRHWVMPSHALERIVEGDNKTFRVLGIKIINLKEVLDAYPEIRKRLKKIILVREKRDKPSKRGIYYMGMANPLLFQDGFSKGSHKGYLYNTDKTINLGDSDIEIADRPGTFVISPFHGNVHIHDGNRVCFYNGRFTYQTHARFLERNKFTNTDYFGLLTSEECDCGDGPIPRRSMVSLNYNAINPNLPELYSQFSFWDDYTGNGFDWSVTETNEEKKYDAVSKHTWFNSGVFDGFESAIGTFTFPIPPNDGINFDNNSTPDFWWGKPTGSRVYVDKYIYIRTGVGQVIQDYLDGPVDSVGGYGEPSSPDFNYDLPFLLAWSGISSNLDATKNFAFYSPETIFYDTVYIPINSVVKPIYNVYSKPFLQADNREQHGKNGALIKDKDKDFIKGFYKFENVNRVLNGEERRSPYYCIHFNWFITDDAPDNNTVNNNPITLSQLAHYYDYNTHNGGMHWNEIIYYMPVQTNDIVYTPDHVTNYLKYYVYNTIYKLNMYDSENTILLTSNTDLKFPELFIPMYVYLGDSYYYQNDLENSYQIGGLEFSYAHQQSYNNVYIANYYNFPDRILDWGQNVHIRINLNNLYYFQVPTNKIVYISLISNEPYYCYRHRNVTEDFYISDKIYTVPDVNVEEEDSRLVNRYIYLIDSRNKNQYGQLDTNEYVYVDEFYNDIDYKLPAISNDYTDPQLSILKRLSNSSSYLILNGDVYLSMFYYRNSIRIPMYNTMHENVYYGGFNRLKDERGAELRGGHFYPVESEINCWFRHRPINIGDNKEYLGQGPKHFPMGTFREALEPRSREYNQVGYNIQYSFQNDKKIFFLKPKDFEIVSEFRNRIIYSNQYLEGDKEDRMRQFEVDAYQDLPKHKGQITNLFTIGNDMYAQTENSIFALFVNPNEMLGNNNAITLGTTGVFVRPPIELSSGQTNTGGTLHKSSCINTPQGYFFVDYNSKKAFLFTGQFIEVSALGLSGFFDRYLRFKGDYINNICNPDGNGIISVYDKLNNRILVSIHNNKEYEKYVTLSFSLNNKKWKSFHSYKISQAVRYNNNVLLTDNVLYQNGIYLNIDGKYGTYYRNETYPFIIEICLNDKEPYTKIFDNISFDLEILNEIYNDILYTKRDKIIFDFLDEVEYYNSYQKSDTIKFKVYNPNDLLMDELDTNVKYYNNYYNIKIQTSVTKDNEEDIFNISNKQNIEYTNRFKDKYLVAKFICYNKKDYLYLLKRLLYSYRINTR